MVSPAYAIGAKLKLTRAQSHIAEIDREVRKYIERAPFRWETSASDEPNHTDITLRLDEAIPDEIATIVGDALHNMRSSLDNLVAGLATRNSATAKQLKQVYFPVGQDQTEFVRKCNDLSKIIGVTASNSIAAAEVFVGGRGEKIKMLGEMSNTDKHRLLIPTIPKIEGQLQLGFGGSQPLPAGFEGRFSAKFGELAIGKIPACDGDLLLSYGNITDDRFFISYQPTLTVSMDFRGLVPGESVVTTLNGMRLSALDAVDLVIAALGT